MKHCRSYARFNIHNYYIPELFPLLWFITYLFSYFYVISAFNSLAFSWYTSLITMIKDIFFDVSIYSNYEKCVNVVNFLWRPKVNLVNLKHRIENCWCPVISENAHFLLFLQTICVVFVEERSHSAHAIVFFIYPTQIGALLVPHADPYSSWFPFPLLARFSFASL